MVILSTSILVDFGGRCRIHYLLRTHSGTGRGAMSREIFVPKPDNVFAPLCVAKTSFDPEDSLSNGAALPMLRGTCSSPGQTAADGEKTVGKNRLWRPGRHRPPFSPELRGPVERRRRHSGARPQKNSIESVQTPTGSCHSSQPLILNTSARQNILEISHARNAIPSPTKGGQTDGCPRLRLPILVNMISP